MDRDSKIGVDRRNVLKGGAALAGTLFLEGCGETPGAQTVFGLSPDKWTALTPVGRGEQVWKFLTTPVEDKKKEYVEETKDTTNWVDKLFGFSK